MKTILAALLGLVVAFGCTPAEVSGSATATDSKTTEAAPKENSVNPDDPKPKEGEEVAVLETNQGRIVLQFFPDKAPKHVENFKKLAKSEFYDGIKFHRVIPGFMIQGGDPNTKTDDRASYGTGGPGWNVDAEFNDVKHDRGILSAARSSDPNSAGSQFFIMVKASPHLDGQYSAYGRVVEGLDVVDKIVALERDARDCPLPSNEAVIKTARIQTWPLKSGE
jgi:cyclophilin family peptidyl-prolyl cis-trans isomerase